MHIFFSALLTIAAVIAGGIASIAGFGIGSILTPTLATQVGTKIAVAAVSLPHVCGTALRLWAIRDQVNRRVLLSFGLTSAAGGLTGALLHVRIQSAALGYTLGVLLVFAGMMELTGLASRLRFGGASAWLAGALSGMFGGLVGNQGGIRSAAMLGFDLSKEAFVATATAIALLVDAARVPVYLAKQSGEMREVLPAIALMTAGVVVGTLFGRQALRKIPEKLFRKIVAVIIVGLGISMFFISGR